MLEVHLRSGQVVAFDGRVVEVFAESGPSRRFHVAQLSVLDAVDAPGGACAVSLEDGVVTLAFAREERPACARLLAAIAESRAALGRRGTAEAPVG
jgi:hypothetical protein